MALSLSSIVIAKNDTAARILIYGQSGIGKTTLAAQFPDPIFLQTERGTPTGFELPSFGDIDSLAKVYEALDVLENEDHDFKTLVIDSVTSMERLIYAHLCAKNRWDNIMQEKFYAGPAASVGEWEKLVRRVDQICQAKGIMVVWTAHETVENVENSEVGEHTRAQPQVYKKSIPTLTGTDMDAVLHLGQDVTIQGVDGKGNEVSNASKAVDGVARSSKTVWMTTGPRANLLAKNRYKMPDRIKIPEGTQEGREGWEAIKVYIPKPVPRKAA